MRREERLLAALDDEPATLRADDHRALGESGTAERADVVARVVGAVARFVGSTAPSPPLGESPEESHVWTEAVHGESNC